MLPLALVLIGALLAPAAAWAQGAPNLTQTVVTLAAGIDNTLAAGKKRKYLCLMNIDTALATLGFDATAVAGTGWALAAASAAGGQGGSICWEGNGVPGNVIHGISAAGTRVAVIEGK